MNKYVFLLLCFLAGALTRNTAQNLYFVKKGQPAIFQKADFQPGKQAFYIYRNCVYDFVLKDGKQISVRVIDIKNDSIYYTPYIGRTATTKDTLSLHPGDLKKIRMIGDRIMALYKSYSLRHCTYVFENTGAPKTFPQLKDTVYEADSSRSTVYDVVPYLTAQGIDRLYQQCGVTYYYRGIGPPACEDTTKNVPPIVKKWIWFTPSAANKIKGLNLGIQFMNIDERPISVNGVNISADVLSMFLTIYAVFNLRSSSSLINMPDTIDISNMKDTVKGLSLSGGGLVGDVMKGVSFNGGVCLVKKASGLVITGTQSLTDGFKGVTISGLRNRAIHGRGVQIGLLNICKDLKGIQLGLWNVNSKRRLPIINWSL